MKAEMIRDYLLLAPTVVLRHHMSDEYDVEFCTHVAVAIVNSPLLRDHATYMAAREDVYAAMESIADVMMVIINDRSFEVAQLLQSAHCAKNLYDRLEAHRGRRAVSQAAFNQIVPALFYSLLRDGYPEQAGRCIESMADENPIGAIQLHIDYLSALVRAGTPADGDTLYDCCLRLIVCYETIPRCVEQLSAITYIMGKMCALELPGDEKGNILARFRAACANLMVRGDRCVATARCSAMYRALGAAGWEELRGEAERMAERYRASAEQRALMELALM